jgi:hypothetical protein
MEFETSLPFHRSIRELLKICKERGKIKYSLKVRVHRARVSLHVGLICGMVCHKISGQPHNSLPSNAFFRLGSLEKFFER